MSNSGSHGKRHRAVGIAALLVCVASLVAMQQSRTMRARLHLTGNSTVLPATIHASRTATVVAEQSGKLVRLAVAPGDTVVEGQEIALLENPALTQALADAELRTTEARSRLAELENPGLQGRLYSERFKAAGTATKQACARAEAFTLHALEEALQTASGKLTQVLRLQMEGMASASEVERLRQDERNASQSLVAAAEVRSRLLQECDSARAQMEILRLQADLERTASLHQAQAEWENAVNRQKSAADQVRTLRILATQAGTVLSVAPTQGQYIHSGMALAELGDVSRLSIDVPVSGKIARLVKKGDVVVVRLPTDPPRDLEVPVSAVVLSQNSQEHPYLIRVQIKNPDPDNVVAGLEGAVIFRHSARPEDTQ